MSPRTYHNISYLRNAIGMGVKRGSILVLTLWGLCLLAVIAVYLGFLVRQKVILVQRLGNRNELHFAAEAGVKRAIIEVTKDEDIESDSFRDVWAQNKQAFKDIQVGNGIFSVSYDYFDDQGGLWKERFGIIDEERKININRADLNTLRRLFISLGFEQDQAQSLAASIIDWRDPDSQLSLPLGSAENSYYTWLPQPYECKNADFEVISELFQVKEVSAEVFDKIKNFITIYGAGQVNINTAGQPVLVSLGIDGGLAEKIIAFRAGADKQADTDDDGYFTQPAQVVTQLKGVSFLSEAEAAQIDNLVANGSFVTASSNFMIRSLGYKRAGPVESQGLLHGAGMEGSRRQIICVVNRFGEVLYYDEL